nr:ABC transporter permease [Paludibacterium denitrificans]
MFGTTPSYLDVRSWNLSDGIPFTDADLRSASRVVLLGQTVVKNLFDTENPVGKTIRIKGSPYTVIGVLGVKGQSLDGRDQDDTALIPVTTANRKLFGGQFPNSVRVIMAQAESAQSMPKVENRLNELLHQRHHIGQGQDDDFSVRNLSALVETAASATKVLSLLLGGIASISLLVGGIGIMNIMLVSVTERTREIGIRAAIGARRRDIMLQFLAESVIISVFGCFIGVVLGVSGAWLVQQATDMTVVVTGFSILMSFGVAASVGIFFGFYPARKASLLKPIDALRQ